MKRKATSPPPTNATMSSIEFIKKGKEMLRCELCQIFATSELTLKQHFEGKRHKSKQARQTFLTTGKTFKIGIFSGNAANSPNKVAEKATAESIEENPKEEISEKKLDEGIVVKTGKDGFRFPFWCVMGNVGTFHEAVMSSHMRGKKHTSRLLEALNSRLEESSANANVSKTTVEKDVTEVKPDVGESKDEETTGQQEGIGEKRESRQGEDDAVDEVTSSGSGPSVEHPPRVE